MPQRVNKRNPTDERISLKVGKNLRKLKSPIALALEKVDKHMNFWSGIPTGDNPPELLNMVIEVASGTRDKYEYDLKWEAFILDRVIPSSVVFPVEYGFVPQTWFDDEDPLDIMVLSYAPLKAGFIVKVRVIGALIIEDEEGLDAKILSVLVNDARFEGYHDIKDVHKHRLIEIQEFFETYKRLEPHKWVKIRDWKNAQDARKIVEYSMEKYRELSVKPVANHR